MQPTTRAFPRSLIVPMLLASSACAQGADRPATKLPVPAPVTDFASAEAAVPKARADLRGAPWSWNHRLAPDGVQAAWLTMHPGQPAGPAMEQPPDRLELLVADGAGGAPRATPLAASFCWGTSGRCGPVWAPDGRSVLIGYHTTGADTVSDVRVDRVGRGGAAQPFLRETGARLQSLGQSRDGGVVAVLLDAISPARTSLCVCDRDGTKLATIDLTGRGCRAASPSPDGTQIAVVADAAVLTVPARGGEPRVLVATANGAAATGCPQWLDDGTSFVVAVGGDVVHVSLAKGQVHRWAAKDLGGAAVAVVVLPGDTIAGAIATHATEATALDLVRHAGDAPQRLYGDLVWLDLRDGSRGKSKLQNQRLVGWSESAYAPRLSELLAAFTR